MYALIAEDTSDVDTLKVLVRRLAGNSALPMQGKGYGGCSALLQKGARDLRLFAASRCKRFIVCYDADGADPDQRRHEAMQKIIKPAALAGLSSLALVPVQEIEAWILADIHRAVPQVIASWKPTPINNPEAIASPKEHLEQLSRGSNKKPRYAHATHNPLVARHLDLHTVARKCPSFRFLQSFVAGHCPIQRPASAFPASAARNLWAYTNPPGSSRYEPTQLATPHDWGQVVAFVQDLDEQPAQLACLCEFGWALLTGLQGEVEAILSSKKPKSRVRAILTALATLVQNNVKAKARHVGLCDGTQ